MSLSRSLAALLLCLAVPANVAPAWADPPPTFTAEADTVRVTEHESVDVSFLLKNHLLVGLYPDSLILTAEDRDPGVTGLPRVKVTSLDGLVRVMAPASSDEERAYSYSGTSAFEHGLLTFRLLAHDANKQPYRFEVPIVVNGSDVSDPFPSEFLGAAAKRTEIVRVPAEGAVGPAPGVLIVPGHGSHARRQIMLARLLAGRGTHVVTMSLPGYGQSAGAADWAGPASLAAIGLAYEALAHTPGVDPKRIALWGQGRGATAALLFAAKTRGVCAVVAQSPDVDLWATYRAADAATQAAIVAAAGRDSAAWRARSPVLQTKTLTARLCVTTTTDEGDKLRASTQAFVERLDKPGSRVEGQIADAKHRQSAPQARQQGLDFLRRRFEPKP